MHNPELHIFLIITEIPQCLELQVSENASFHDILQALEEMNLVEPFPEDTLIYERESLQRCDMDVSLSFLHVQNGMVFQVY